MAEITPIPDPEHNLPEITSNPAPENAKSNGIITTQGGSFTFSASASAEKALEFEDVEAHIRFKDFKQKQVFHGWILAWLAYQSVGVIYGDIGTSPLYVFSSTFPNPPSHEDLLGALSLIIWSLTIVVTIKYVIIVLCADDDGEGGTFALYSLITRYSNIMLRNPREPLTVKLERHLTGNMKSPNLRFRSALEENWVLRSFVKFLAVFGVCMVIADGVLTPAQSVLGAIQGIKVVAPDITTGKIVGISCSILVLLFLVQPLGITKLGSTFAPIVILWLSFNAGFGIYNLAHFDHSVLKAFNPAYSFEWFIRNGGEGWKRLGAILLAFTGVEALYADLGAFSARAVRLSWVCFAYPCLLLAYIGQAAYISKKPEAVSNPFFNTVPPGMYWPSLVLSILAAIVASQAMITGSFQLISQTMSLSYFPKVRLVHTSDKFYGQLYIPLANWLMMIGTVIVTAIYNNTTSLGNAYGVCVIFVAFITTLLVSIVAVIVWQLHFLIVIVAFIFFGTFDALFLSAALTKVPEGAWFTLLLALLLSCVLFTWRFGKHQQWKSEAGDSIPSSKLVYKGEDGKLLLNRPDGPKELGKIKGVGIFFDKLGYLAPAVYTHFVRKFEAQHDVIVFFHLRQLIAPTVREEERFVTQRVGNSNTFRIIVRHGYNDHVFTENFGLVLYDQLKAFLSGEQDRERAEQDLVSLDAAYEKQVIYILGKEQLKIENGTWVGRKIALETFAWMRENTRTKAQEFNIPIDQLVEVGYIEEI
ncbi:potassium uptake protein [Choiromyces venosus 120613-1]|uniref:Potassium uptake protein n=1 Tax=Choiromyces venosus 120613-1 TaxID=1336337 RepID=A0A3N4JQU7_9PEZI|nr:potassium uptake protein [Choiromyces venosus 120613-1]